MDKALQQIFTNIPFYISFVDKEMRVIHLNPAMEALMGIRIEEARGRHCYDCWGQYAGDGTRKGKERLCNTCQVPAALQSGEKRSYERKLGDKFYEVITTPVRDTNGDIVGAMETGFDVTERHLITQALEESEKRYRSLFESSPNILCIANFSGIKRYLTGLSEQGIDDHAAFFQTHPNAVATCLSQLQISEVNQSALSLFGASSQQEFIENLFTIIGPETIPFTIEGICAIGKGETSRKKELILYHLQGAKFYGILRWSVAPGYEEGYERVVLSFTDITDRKKAEDALAEHRKQLQKLSSRLIETEELERRRFSRELHDQIGQQLAVLGVNLHILEQSIAPEQHQLVKESQELISAMTGKVRDIMADLRPPVLDDFGLQAALHWYGPLYTKRTGVAINVQVDIPRLPENLEITLFRITQEVLENIISHSHATRVEIRCTKDDNLLSLVIQDNGSDLYRKQRAEWPESLTWDLLSMRERVESFGGKLTVIAGPEGGTIIAAEVRI